MKFNKTMSNKLMLELFETLHTHNENKKNQLFIDEWKKKNKQEKNRTHKVTTKQQNSTRDDDEKQVPKRFGFDFIVLLFKMRDRQNNNDRNWK